MLVQIIGEPRGREPQITLYLFTWTVIVGCEIAGIGGWVDPVTKIFSEMITKQHIWMWTSYDSLWLFSLWCVLTVSHFSPTGGSVDTARLPPVRPHRQTRAASTNCSLLVILIRRSTRKTTHFHVQVSTLPLTLRCCLCSAVTFLPVPPPSPSSSSLSSNPLLSCYVFSSFYPHASSSLSIPPFLPSRFSVSCAQIRVFALYECALWVTTVQSCVTEVCCCVWLKLQVRCEFCCQWTAASGWRALQVPL